jgi:putative ABC transport system substrate-binding protein
MKSAGGRPAARWDAAGCGCVIVDAGSDVEASAAFATLHAERADALFIAADGFLNTQLRDPLVALAARHRLPTMYAYRDFVTSGGLICYTSSSMDAGRQAGVYAGRILKGAKPTDLPVTQPTPVRAPDQSQDRQGSRPQCAGQADAIADEVID